MVYLDADTLVLYNIDGLAGDHDVGLTVRPEWEVEKVIRKINPDNYFFMTDM